ncbi:MAG: SIMPL domain-containing protein [Methanotrichaceae archaeon]
MKSLHAQIIGLVVLLASISLCIGADDETSTLIVTGTGEVNAEPDMVIVVLGVETSDVSAANAVTENMQLMTDTVKALNDAGVSEDYIKTSRFDIFPVRDWTDGEYSDVVEFEVTNQVTFTMNNLTDETDIGELLDIAVSAGANTVESVSFGLSNPTSVQEEALADAVADAMKKAKAIAEAAGVNLGKILTISESGSAPIPVENRMYFVPGSDSSTPIMPSDVEVKASVTIIYEIFE